MSNPHTSRVAGNVLSRYGLSVKEVLDNPEEVLDVPSPPFPEGRKYYFAKGREVALVVSPEGILISSLPGHKAMETVEKYRKVSAIAPGIFRNGTGWTLGHQPVREVWAVQHLATDGGVWTVHAVKESREIAILFEQDVIVDGITNLHALEDYEPEPPSDIHSVPGAVIELAWYIQGQVEKEAA